MSFENRGGVARPKVLSIGTNGQQHNFKATTKHLQISNEGGFVLRVYFTEAAFTADSDEFIALAATTGFFEGPVEAESVWLRAVGGTTSCTVVPYYRKG